MTTAAPKVARPVTGHRLVRADAGTGKTYSLALRFVRLVDRGAQPSRLLAATFTRKAAGEILQRILLRLARASLDPRAADRLAREIGKPKLGSEDFENQLERLTADLHRVSVSTLDSFFHRIVQCFRFELGIGRFVSVAATTDSLLDPLRQRALEAMLEELSADDIDELAELLGRFYRGEARRSVARGLDLVLSQLYERYLEAREPALWRQLPLGGGTLEDAELDSLIDHLAGAGAAESNRSLVAAIDRDVRQAERRDWRAFLDNGLGKAHRIDPDQADADIPASTISYRKAAVPESISRLYRPLVDHAQSELVARISEQTRATERLLRSFHRHFERIRQGSGIVLYADLVSRLAGQLSTDPAGDVTELLAEIYYRIDGRIEHLLLDEFQDTSLEQWRALWPIVEELLAYGDGSRTLFVVGDPKQAIYGWRGGCAELFDELAYRFELSGFERATLDTSYRSTPIVLDAVNRIFGQLEDSPALAVDSLRPATQNWAGRFSPHRVARSTGADTDGVFQASGFAEAQVGAEPDREPRSASESPVARVATLSQGLPGYVRLETSSVWEGVFEDESEEATAEAFDDPGGGVLEPTRPLAHLGYAAEQIREIAERLPGASIGALVQTNRTATELLDRVRDRGVAASGEGSGSIVDDPAVAVILSALVLADHPGDRVALFHLRSSPLAASLLRLAEVDGASSRARSFDPSSMSRAVRRQLAERGAAKVVAGWARDLAPSCDRRGAIRLAQLVELIDLQLSVGGRTAERWIDLVRVIESARVEEPMPAAVRVMTVHKSKGLEFDVVVLCELERRIGDLNNPTIEVFRESETGPVAAVYRSTNQMTRSGNEALRQTNAQEVARRVADDLSVLYVATTRARYELHAFVQPLRRTKKGVAVDRRTAASVLRWGLCARATPEQRATGASRLFESGEPLETLPGRGRAPADEAAGDNDSAERRVEPVDQPWRADFRHRRKSRRPTRWLRPSELSSLGRASAADLLRLDRDLGRERGDLLHAWLAEIEYLGESATAGLPSAARRTQIAAAVSPGIDSLEADELWDRLRETLREPSIRRLFERPGVGRGETLELWRERSYLIELGGVVQRGVFDRVLIQRRSGICVGAELVELKSDRVGADGGRDSLSRYRPQIEAYRNALAHLLGVLPTAVLARLAFLSSGQVFDV